MKAAEIGSHLKVAVVAKLSDGTIAMQSPRENPLEFELGSRKLLKGFSDALTGMKAGETKRFNVPARDAFGENDPDKRLFVEKGEIDDLKGLTIGDRINLMPRGGREVSGWIEAFQKNEVVINRNHRLAGEDLDMEIELLAVD